MHGRNSSGDLGMDTLPIKRKSPRQDGRTCLLGSGAPPTCGSPPQPAFAGTQPQQRTSCGPTCSSPALGGWCQRRSIGKEEEGDSRLSGELARGKVQRVCANAAAAAASGVCAAGSRAAAAATAAGLQAASFDGPAGSQQLHIMSGLLPGMYRSYHMGCCSRLSSSSSLSELEAGAGAAIAAEATLPAEAMPHAAVASSSQQGGCAPPEMQRGMHPTCSCGACSFQTAAVAAAGYPRGLEQHQPFAALGTHHQQQHRQVEEAAAELSQWADMPDDILKRVLERLAPYTLRVLRLVCRGWEAATSRLLCHLRPETVVGKRLGCRFPALHSLDLSNALMGVDFATPRMLRLQSLLRDEHLAELAGLTCLEQLSLRDCIQLSGRGLVQLGRLSNSLTMLNLSNCSGITDECLARLSAAVPRLATLNLQGCCRVGDDGIVHLVAMPELRHVLLPGGVSDISMQMLADMPALERVALRGCSHVTTAGIYVLLQRRGLKRVVISKCPHVTLENLCSESSLRVVAEGSLPSGTATAATLDAALVPVAVAALVAGGGGTAADLTGQGMHRWWRMSRLEQCSAVSSAEMN